jgi:AcrR family transcriptional regulator
VEAISDVADVPPATVYRLFASKHGILRAVLDVAIVGDDQAVAMADRPQVRSLLDAPDPRAQLEGFASISAQVNARVALLYGVLVSAAGSDHDAAALLDTLTQQRQHGQRLIARSLARAGALRSDVRERDAADVIHALLSPEMYRLLVIDRGWSADRYQQWVAATLADQLLPTLDPQP